MTFAGESFVFLPCYCTFSHENKVTKRVVVGCGSGYIELGKGWGKQCSRSIHKIGGLGTLYQLCIRSLQIMVGDR